MIPADVRRPDRKRSVRQPSDADGRIHSDRETRRSADAVDQRGSTGAPRSLLDLETACFMGSNVVSGAATAVVAATGNATYFGAMAKDIVGARPLTSFDKGISRVSWMLIRFILVMTPVVFLINGFTKGELARGASVRRLGRGGADARKCCRWW